MRLRAPRTRTKALQMRLRVNSNRSSESLSRPVLTYSVIQKQLKGEDVMFAIDDLASLAQDRQDLGHWSVYAICDGHGGSNAAKFVRKYLGVALTKVLPAGPPPTPNQPEKSTAFCEQVRHALVKAFVSLHDAFASDACHSSGTTLTVVLVCDWLLTCANVADSEAFLDLGHCIVELTNCHKVENNRKELSRLAQSGALIKRLSRNGLGPVSTEDDSGRGPLRVWPGGIAMSRSIGDFKCSPEIVPIPHLRQFWVPKNGARLIMASDGLWDHIHGTEASKLVRNSLIQAAPRELLNEARGEDLSDDISILVLDLMPSKGIDFSQSLPVQSQSKFKAVRGYLRRRKTLSRMKRKTEAFVDIDGLEEYPNMLENIVPEICEMSISQPENEEESRSRASSIASENWDLCECSWDDESLDHTSHTWEKDDRDILDSAQNYIQSIGCSSNQNPKSSKLKMMVIQVSSSRREKSEKLTAMSEFLDTSLLAPLGSSMATIHEPEEETD